MKTSWKRILFPISFPSILLVGAMLGCSHLRPESQASSALPHVGLELRLVRIGESDFLNDAALQKAAEQGDAAAFTRMIETKKDIDILAIPPVETLSGTAPALQISRVFCFPTGYEWDAKRKAYFPSSFDKIDIGTDADLTPLVHGQEITLNGEVRINEFDGFVTTGRTKVLSPTFHIKRTRVFQSLRDGESVVLRVPGVTFSPVTLSGRPLVQKPTPTQPQILLIILRAWIVSPKPTPSA
jgi:hypothetical protein